MRHNARQSDNICFYFEALFLFTRETIAECLSNSAIQPRVSSSDSNAEQRLQMALAHFMHEYFVVSKQE